jgi:hypothetical protein
VAGGIGLPQFGFPRLRGWMTSFVIGTMILVLGRVHRVATGVRGTGVTPDRPVSWATPNVDAVIE